MRVFEEAITGEIVNDGNFSVGAEFGFGPDLGAFGAGGISVLP